MRVGSNLFIAVYEDGERSALVAKDFGRTRRQAER
jgi:hypothetical protein